MASTPPAPKPIPSADVFRNERGAFDLPSILVGVVVVGILTAGVLAAIFGVIPFAQDKGAEQDLDSVRTAQGIAKTKDGRFDTSDVLIDRGYLSTPGNVATAANGSGSCYVAASRSGSGKTFLASSDAPAPVHLTEAPSDACLSIEQLKQLVQKIGGAWPGGEAGSAPTYTAIAASEVSTANFAATPALLAYLNADLALESSPESLALVQSDYATWDAYAASPSYLAYQAAIHPSVSRQFSEMSKALETEYPDVMSTKTAWWDAQDTFYGAPTEATQRNMVDAQRAFYLSVLSKPSEALPELIAAPSFSSTFGDRTIAAGTQRMTFTVAVAPGTDVSVIGPGSQFFGEAWTAGGTKATGNVIASGMDNGYQYWSIEVESWENDPDMAGQDMDVFVGVRINGILHYKTFKVTVAP